MTSRFRLFVLCAACLVLVGALSWSLSDSPPVPESSGGSSPEASAARPPPVSPSPESSPRALSGAPVSAPVGAQEVRASSSGGAPWPEPEGAASLPQENDTIEPEQPQTAAWRHEKLVRITELLERDVARMEKEWREALAGDDEDEVRRLAVRLSRHRARVESLRRESAAMAEVARAEEDAR